MKLQGFLSMILAILLVSCSEDNGSDVIEKGVLQIYGSKFSLVSGAIEKKEKPGGGQGFVYYIDLYSSGIDSVTGEGMGHVVSLDIYPESENGSIDGTYSMDTNSEADGLFGGLVYLDYNTESNEFYSVYLANTGTSIISESAGVYELTIDIQADEYIRPEDSTNYDVKVSCHYEGSLIQRALKKK